MRSLMNEAKTGFLKPTHAGLTEPDQFRHWPHLGFLLRRNAVVDHLCVLLAGKGVSQAAEEDSSGIGIHRLGLG